MIGQLGHHVQVHAVMVLEQVSFRPIITINFYKNFEKDIVAARENIMVVIHVLALHLSMKYVPPM